MVVPPAWGPRIGMERRAEMRLGVDRWWRCLMLALLLPLADGLASAGAVAAEGGPVGQGGARVGHRIRPKKRPPGEGGQSRLGRRREGVGGLPFNWRSRSRCGRVAARPAVSSPGRKSAKSAKFNAATRRKTRGDRVEKNSDDQIEFARRQARIGFGEKCYKFGTDHGLPLMSLRSTRRPPCEKRHNHSTILLFPII